jgi:outer membrane biosynthesis protein TonB
MMSNARRTSLAPRAALLLALAAGLSGCGATMSKLPESLGGLSEGAPQVPAEAVPFPNVYEKRPTREAKPLDDVEQKKLESELATLRDNQNQRANPPPPPPVAPVKKPAPKDAASKKPAKKPAKKPQAEAAAPAKKDAPPPLRLSN